MPVLQAEFTPRASASSGSGGRSLFPPAYSTRTSSQSPIWLASPRGARPCLVRHQCSGARRSPQRCRRPSGHRRRGSRRENCRRTAPTESSQSPARCLPARLETSCNRPCRRATRRQSRCTVRSGMCHEYVPEGPASARVATEVFPPCVGVIMTFPLTAPPLTGWISPRKNGRANCA